MVREFRYRGHSLEQVESMSLEAFLELLPSRQRRSLNRGISPEKRTLIEDVKAAKAGKGKGPIDRSGSVSTGFGRRFSVYSRPGLKRIPCVCWAICSIYAERIFRFQNEGLR